jgi:hypothetical protein
MVNKMQCLQCSWALPKDSKHDVASFFFDDFDEFIVLTSHLDAWFFRSGDFCADDNRQTKPSALLIAYTVGGK